MAETRRGSDVVVREEVKNQSGPVGFGGRGTLSRSKYPVRQETLRPGPEHLGFQAGERAEICNSVNRC